MSPDRVPYGLRLILALAAAVGVAAAAGILLRAPEPPAPDPALKAAAEAVRGYYAGRPLRDDWRVVEVTAGPGAVEVLLRLPGGQVAGLLQSPIGFQRSMLARACPPAGAAVWSRLDADTDIRLAAEDRHGERFLPVSCRAFRPTLDDGAAD